MSRLFSLAVICFIIFACIGCATKKEPWPQRVVNSLWIPNITQIDKQYHEGSYTVEYTTNVCYPAKDLIDEMEKTMTSKGWRRLEYDPFNPSVSLNHKVSEWNHVLDRDYRAIYGWTEFWDDNEKNVIEYRFKYQPKKGNIITRDDCSLQGFSSYIPMDMVDAMFRKIKEIEKDMRERGKR